MFIYNAPIKEVTVLDPGLNTFTAKATISLKDVTNPRNMVVIAPVTGTPQIVHFNNNISLVSQKKGVAPGKYSLIYSSNSGVTPYIFAGNKALKWTIDITSQDSMAMNVAGINSAGNLNFYGLNYAAKFRAAITASATGAHTVEVDGIKTGGRLDAGDIMGAIKVTAKGTGAFNTAATGINAVYGATINKLGADITVSATKGKNSQNAYARGIYHASSNNSLSIYTAITKKISATTKHSGTGNAYANGITGGVNIELAGVAKSGAITASATADSGNAYASAISSVGEAKYIRIMTVQGKISASATAGGFVNVQTVCTEDTFYLYNFSGTISASGTSKSGKSIVAAISAKGVKTSGEIKGNITANASSKGGSVSAYGINVLGGADFEESPFSSNIQVKASQTDRNGIGGIEAYGIFAQEYIAAESPFSANITINAANASKSGFTAAYGIFCQNEDEDEDIMDLSDFAGKISVNSAGAGYGICTGSSIQGDHRGNVILGNCSGSIAINANENAYGIESTGIKFDSITGTITAKSKTGNAVGLYAKNIGLYSFNSNWQTDLGKITVSTSSTDANHSAKAIYATGILKVSETKEITGDFTVTSKSYAYGIHAKQGIESGDKISKISVKMNVTGAFGAYAIKTDQDGIKPLNLWFEGAQITTKVTDKFCTGDQYAIRAMNTTDDAVWVAGKSKLTGKINLGNGNDIVMIYAGSKVTGAFEGVECVEFILDDATQAGQTMWDKVDGSFGSTDMLIDLDYGTTGEFALCSRTSKDTAWSDIFDDIQLNFGAGLDSKALNLGTATEIDGYSYELKEKGNKLVLSVSLAN